LGLRVEGWSLRFGIRGLGFGDLGFGAQGSGFGARVSSLGLGLGFRVWGGEVCCVGFEFWGSGLRGRRVRFRVWGSGFRV